MSLNSFSWSGMSGGAGGNGGGVSSFSQSVSDLIRNEMDNCSNKEEAMKNVLDKLGIQDYIIVFFGFQGALANKFSMIKKDDAEEVKMRLFALNDSVSPVFQDIIQFYEFYNRYDKPKDTINPITMEEALSILRVGEKLHRKEEKFEDSEVDEFDDNCTDDCIPGSHKCGK